MPISPVTISNQEIREVVADRSHLLRAKSRFLDRAYFTTDSRGRVHVQPGLVVAVDSTTSKYVPYNATALYGIGSDTAVGITDDFIDLTLTGKEVGLDPIFHGKLIEAHCYVWGGALGTIAAGIKTDLQMVEWV